MSLLLSQTWEDRLKSHYTKYTEKERDDLFKIINQFECNEIYNPNINEHEIFEHIYKQSSHEGGMTAKRQPNPFMIFRTTLGITASRKSIKLGDGTFQSKTAGLLWRGAKQYEKRNFEILSSKFKDLHKIIFPAYEYKPRQRNPVAGTFVDMSNNNFGTRVIESNNQSMSQQSHISRQIQQISNDNSNATWDQTSLLPPLTNYTGLDSNFMIGGWPYQLQQNPLSFCQIPQFPSAGLYAPQSYLPAEDLYQTNPLNNELNMLNKIDYFQQAPPPSIAENCPIQYFDINYGTNF